MISWGILLANIFLGEWIESRTQATRIQWNDEFLRGSFRISRKPWSTTSLEFWCSSTPCRSNEAMNIYESIRKASGNDPKALWISLLGTSKWIWLLVFDLKWSEMICNNSWLVVWLPFLAFSQKYWESHHPKWLSYFSEGWPNHQPDRFPASFGYHFGYFWGYFRLSFDIIKISQMIAPPKIKKHIQSYLKISHHVYIFLIFIWTWTSKHIHISCSSCASFEHISSATIGLGSSWWRNNSISGMAMMAMALGDAKMGEKWRFT